jgi:MFS family permease
LFIKLYIYFIFQVFSAILSSFMMRRISTKILFIVCYSIIILSDISLATFSYLKTHHQDPALLDGVGWLPLVFVTCIASAHSTGTYPVIQLLLGELFPTDIRSLAIGLTLSAVLCMGTTNILIYSYLIESFQFFGTFYFYAATSCVTLLWGIFQIPDNRGLSLAKVEEKFSKQNLDQTKKPDEAE